MEKGYLKCKSWLTPMCPKVGDTIMQKFFLNPGNNNTIEELKYDDLVAANSLCKSCDMFIPHKGQ